MDGWTVCRLFRAPPLQAFPEVFRPRRKFPRFFHVGGGLMQQASRLANPRFRTRVGNGKTLFLDPGIDGRTIQARRFQELYAQGVSDLGGDLSMAQQGILRMAVAITVDCEMAQAALVAGAPFDVAKFSTASNAARRLYETLGIQRKARDVTPSLDDYLSQHPDVAPAHPLATSDTDEDEEPETDAPGAEEADNSTSDPESVD